MSNQMIVESSSCASTPRVDAQAPRSGIARTARPQTSGGRADRELRTAALQKHRLLEKLLEELDNLYLAHQHTVAELKLQVQTAQQQLQSAKDEVEISELQREIGSLQHS